MHSKLVIASIFAVLLAPLEAEAIECVGDRTYDTAVADGCTSITGLLYIYNNDALTNIDGLAALTSVGGYLYLFDNDALTNIDGLAALFSVGGGAEFDPADPQHSSDGLHQTYAGALAWYGPLAPVFREILEQGS